MSTTADVRQFVATRDDGSKVSLSVRKPTQRELELGDFEFSRMYNQALLNGLPTRDRHFARLKQTDNWSEQQEQEMERLRLAAVSLEAKATAKGVPDAERKELETQFAKALADFNVYRQDIESMLSHTADAKADNAYRNFMICCVTEGEKGRLWASVGELMTEKDQALTNRVFYEYIRHQAGLPSEWKDRVATAAAVSTTTAPVNTASTPPSAGDAPPSAETTPAVAATAAAGQADEYGHGT